MPPANTEALDDGKYVTHSSLSVVASRATVKGVDVVANSVLSTGGTFTAQGASTFNAAATFSTGTVTVSGSGLIAPLFASSSTTAQSGATAKLGQGQLYFSVLSLTTNGGEFGFRSGNTVYRFQSTAVG